MAKYKKIEEGVCPVCGDDDLDYGAIEVEGNMIYYPWTCNACGTTGEEWYELHFTGHNVNTKDGNQDILEV